MYKTKISKYFIKFHYRKFQDIQFNAEQFESRHYAYNEEITSFMSFFSKDDTKIETMSQVRDLGIIMSSYTANFGEHINIIFVSDNLNSGWIIRTMKTRDEAFFGSPCVGLLLPTLVP